MSLKPSKFSDQRKLEEKLKEKQKRMETLNQIPPYTMIVCEGTKTEPIYLKGLTNKINGKFKDLIKKERISVHGTGRNTDGLLKWTTCKVESGEWEKYQDIWLVYDKDDFPYDDFDNTQYSVETRKDKRYHVAWSNESIELWFLLHFQDWKSDTGRAQYIEKLKENIDYSKTYEDLYDVIMEKGSLKDAKRRAKQLMKEHKENKITSPSAMVPGTRINRSIRKVLNIVRKRRVTST